MDNCSETGFCSHIDGFTADVTLELAKMFNFNWTLTKFPSDDYGTSPNNGNWSDPKATFGGILGTIFYTL